MVVALLLLSFVLGGVGRRIAGGWLQDIGRASGWLRSDQPTPGGDMPVRGIYGILLGIVVLVSGISPWWWSGPMAIAVFGGSCMGTPEVSTLSHAALKGFLDWIIPAALLWVANYYIGSAIILAAGTFGAPLLLALIRPKPAEPDYISWKSGPVGLRGGTQLWEFAWGGVMGAACFLGVI